MRVLGRVRHRVSSFLGRTGGASITLDYPPNARNEPRWMPHPGLERIIAARGDAYAAVLDTIQSYRVEFSAIPVTATNELEPAWVNGFQPGLDAGAIYSFLRSRSPARYMEIGSGWSTKFARRAIQDGELPTQITSVDPNPRAEIDQLCDRVIRSALEATDLALVDELRAGDILFFDGSHRVFMNSDVTVFFLELLPRLPSGVLVAIHDTYLPFDYPAEIAYRYYSEQYLLASYLLAGSERFHTVLPAWYVSQTERFRPAIESLWGHDPALADVQRHGVAYWIETR